MSGPHPAVESRRAVPANAAAVVQGGSGGGPHSLATAALLTDGVIRCAAAVLAHVPKAEPLITDEGHAGTAEAMEAQYRWISAGSREAPSA